METSPEEENQREHNIRASNPKSFLVNRTQRGLRIAWFLCSFSFLLLLLPSESGPLTELRRKQNSEKLPSCIPEAQV